MERVLVELPEGAGLVRGDDGELVLTDDVRDGHGQRLRAADPYRPGKTQLDRERSLVGGLLPPGAVAAEAVDDQGVRVTATVANGAYAAILEQPMDGHEPTVCCRDASGDLVRRPLPADYPCAPVRDAEEPCPACGAISYEECIPTEGWRGGTPGPGGTTIPSPIVVCRVCGHEEAEGSLMRVTATDDEDPALRAEREAKWRAEWRVQRWYANTMLLRGVTFPIYAAEGWPAQINGSGSSGDDVTQVTIAHTDGEDADLLDERPRIEVTTAIDDGFGDETWHARSTLEGWIHDEVANHPRSDDLSDAAITLWFRAVDRLRRAAALAAERTEATIPIDGAPQPFVSLTTPSGRWVAVRRHDDLVVTLAGHDLDPATLTIEPIADPAARLLGPAPAEPGEG